MAGNQSLHGQSPGLPQDRSENSKPVILRKEESVRKGQSRGIIRHAVCPHANHVRSVGVRFHLEDAADPLAVHGISARVDAQAERGRRAFLRKLTRLGARPGFRLDTLRFHGSLCSPSGRVACANTPRRTPVESMHAARWQRSVPRSPGEGRSPG